MGLSQRRKGIRVEYLVRDYFRELGYVADRVPSSGAAEGFKGDVEVSKDGLTFKVECKARKDDFDSIYHVLSQNKDENGTFRFALLSKGPFVAIGRNFEDVKRTNNVHFPILAGDSSMRTYRKVLNLQKLLGECQYLAIKGNNKPVLFLRFWN